MDVCQCKGDKGDVKLNDHFIIESILTARQGKKLQYHTYKISGYTIVKGLRKSKFQFHSKNLGLKVI